MVEINKLEKEKPEREIKKHPLLGEKNFKIEKIKKKINLRMVLVVVGLVAAGIATGYFLYSRQGTENQPIGRDVSKEEVTKGLTVGIADEKTFRDSAEGKLEKGGISGEGSHHLVRPGGETQNVYLTSSLVDLDKFVGRQVKVWGETFSAKKAGWLMDVGKLKVLD